MDDQIKGQITIDEWLGLDNRRKLKTIKQEHPEEPEIGAWVETHGAVIPHIMRPHYIGKKVVMDKSTASRTWFRVGILERYFPNGTYYRAVIFDGDRQRQLIDFWPGVEIYECLPWGEYPERMKAIYKNELGG